MLQVEPAMLPRLDVLEADLLGRRTRAEQERWFGEIEGLDLTCFTSATRGHAPSD
jgi:hypothetical protein